MVPLVGLEDIDIFAFEILKLKFCLGLDLQLQDRRKKIWMVRICPNQFLRKSYQPSFQDTFFFENQPSDRQDFWSVEIRDMSLVLPKVGHKLPTLVLPLFSG